MKQQKEIRGPQSVRQKDQIRNLKAAELGLACGFRPEQTNPADVLTKSDGSRV